MSDEMEVVEAKRIPTATRRAKRAIAKMTEAELGAARASLEAIVMGAALKFGLAARLRGAFEPAPVAELVEVHREPASVVGATPSQEPVEQAALRLRGRVRPIPGRFCTDCDAGASVWTLMRGVTPAEASQGHYEPRCVGCAARYEAEPAPPIQSRRLTDAQVIAIRARWAERRGVRGELAALAQEFGVPYATVFDLLRRGGTR